MIQTGIEPQFILFFDCSEEEMQKRLLSRNQVTSDLHMHKITYLTDIIHDVNWHNMQVMNFLLIFKFSICRLIFILYLY